MLNPVSVITMLLVGYLLAIAVQTLLGFGYTRLGRGLLMTQDDCWTPAYFGLTGFAWIITMAIATFLTLPLADVAGRRQSGEAALLLDFFLILFIVIRNRKLNPRLQSNAMTVLLSLCIVAGSVAGAVMRVRHPVAPTS